MKSNDAKDFEQFMHRRQDVARAYVSGQATPLEQIVTHRSPATFFSPRGDFREGAEDVALTYTKDASAFEEGGESKIEILQMGASDGLAYYVGIQRANVHMRGKPKPVSMSLRITEIFRREGKDWKLIHRHADMLKSEESEESNTGAASSKN